MIKTHDRRHQGPGIIAKVLYQTFFVIDDHPVQMVDFFVGSLAVGACLPLLLVNIFCGYDDNNE